MKVIIANNEEVKVFNTVQKYQKKDVTDAFSESGAKGYIVEGSDITEASLSQIEELYR